VRVCRRAQRGIELATDERLESGHDFGGRARRAISWTAGFQIFRDVLQFGLMLVLVRLLPPEAYGQFGFVTALIGFLTLYSFREFVGHTLIVRDTGQVHYQDHFTFGVAVQAGVFVLTNAVAIGLRWFPAYAPVAPVLHVMSVLFLFDLPAELRVKMLERVLDWRRLRLLHAVALVASGALSIAMAASGAGVYALLVPTLIVPLVFAGDLLVRAGWRPTWEFSWDRFRPSWAFGASRISAVSFVSGAGLVEASWLSAFGFAAYGIFGRAVGLGQLLCGRVAGLLAQSVFPVLARIPARSDEYRRASALYLRGVAWVVVPLGALAAILADPIVRLIYGSQWLEVIPLMPWAMAGAMLVAIVHTGYILLLAHEQQSRCLRADVWRLVGTVGALAALAGSGMKAYLVGMAAVHAVSLGLVLFWLTRGEAVRAADVRRALIPPAVSIGVAAAAVELTRRAAVPGEITFPIAVGEGVAIGILYVGVLRMGFSRQLGDLVALLPERTGLSRLLRLERAA